MSASLRRAATVATAYPRALAALLGLKFKMVGGYAGSNQIYLAMERGEIEAICEGIDGIVAKRPTWIPEKIVTLLLQGGAAPNPDLKDVPFVIDHAKNPYDRLALEFLYAAEGIGRPFFAPPDLSPAVHTMPCATPSTAPCRIRSSQRMRRNSASIRGQRRRLPRWR